MQRKTFLKQSGIIAFGFAAYGNIHWDGEAYVGDSPTTTDILGPFYRPGAPLRTNINPAGYNGEILKLTGTVYGNDAATPASRCKIEIWQWGSATFKGRNTEAVFVLGEHGTASLHFEFLRRREIKLDGKKILDYQNPILK